MELTLANAISSMLVLGFKSLLRDLEFFFSSAHYLLQFLPSKWNTLWVKSNTSGAKASCSRNILGGDKRMQTAEFDWVMNRLGMVGLLDDGGQSGNLGEEEFLDLFVEEEPSFEEMKEAFGVFDVNKDGFIDAVELQRVVCNLGLKEGCSLEECKRMIESCDSNGDGLIDLLEFVKFMEKCLC